MIRPSIRDIKNELRRIYSSKRAKIEDTYHKEASEKIINNFLESSYYKEADVVLLYLSINREVRTRALVDRILKDNKALALPVCFDNSRMCFRYITDKSQLTKGKFSAPEPNDTCPEYKGEGPCVCVIPALAFDKKGFRLGYGKGYYDRYLSKFNVKKVGFCFEELFVESLPHGRYDAASDAIITEKGVYSINEN